ncbi:Qat anti-phage system ATPase QatA [Sinorhizobium medicae]|uniref:Qat anti-phage system ATPase QatA n=1 Tax=Sinorhizobium medicae TaxID=110321 RepID=UPI002B1BDA40|nr:Qat anti-phage system ATPase QatA [Sinorhizobium medicae]WQO45914.1 Qat anti-phage system ATPase QatA [Sinorhizobium medicae]
MLIPDQETEVDYLHYEAVSLAVVEILRDNRKRALTVGIHGDWGAGKSSVLKMIETGLADDKSVACLWFNGWAFQGFDDAKTVLIEATITELCRQRSAVGKVKELGTKLLKRIDFLKIVKRGSGLAFNVVTGLPSPDQIGTVIEMLRTTAAGAKTLSANDVQSGIEEALTFLKPDNGASVPQLIHDFREDFRKLLDEAKIEQLVVLIDDLDRCLPATAIETLEAIRLFLFVPKTAFVIGADEGMIEYAVRQHFPDLPVVSGPMPYARNYLEKLIQVPFRIPALGAQETRAYVTLLLIQSLVGEDHAGFGVLLNSAKEVLNKPWLGGGIGQAEVLRVDPARKDELNAAFVLAQQIGPILAEGTRGNPRQVKRFLNALMIRQAIARARHFDDLLHRPALAKLMLAERFQPDFYEHVSAQAMVAGDGRSRDLQALEKAAKPGDPSAKTKTKQVATDETEDLSRWEGRDWLNRWLLIEPVLGEEDLRPYVFVARDKRLLAAVPEAGGLAGLIERLSGTTLAVKSVEPEVKALPASDAEQVFSALRERVLQQPNLSSPPPGIEGLGIVARHHTRFQTELTALLGSLDVKTLGPWIVKGWASVLTDAKAKDQFNAVLVQWANQDENALLKTAAGGARAALKTGTR